jgi:nucleoside-diphosphate-sugar epimerase
MADPEILHVVFGASGGLGQALVRQLAAQGRRVRAVTRAGGAPVPPGVEVVRADARDKGSARQASAGAGVIYHAVNVPYMQWPEVLPVVMENLIAAATSAEARLVYGDNLYLYGKVEGPLREDLPIKPAGAKGELRARLADSLLGAHRAGKLEAAIGRASDYYGPGSTNTITSLQVIEPVLKGKKAMWIGDLDVPHSFSYTDDVARGLIVLGERPEAAGEAWHIPAGEPLTGRGFIELVCEAAGVEPKYGAYSRGMMRLVSVFSPLVGEVLENLYQFEEPFVLDGGKFEGTFGALQTTPHREGVGETIEWYRDQKA